MSRILMTIAVEDAAAGPLGAKEAAAMALEELGGVRVLRVDVREPEQMRIEGAVERMARPQRTPAAPPRADKPAAGRRRSGPSSSTEMFCCLTCARYRHEPGQTEAGEFYWGVCRRSGELVCALKDQCGAWMRKEHRP